MRLWTNTLLRLLAGTYFVLTSMYSLLAFLPYTFFFLIKAPPYAWMPWFVRHHAALYWLAAAAGLAASWDIGASWKSKDRRFLGTSLGLALPGVYLTVRPLLATLDSTRSTYWWSIAALLPLAAMSLGRWPMGRSHDARPSRGAMFPYSGAILIAAIVCAIDVVGTQAHAYSQTHAVSFHSADAMNAVWSLISHVVLALAVLFVVNVVAWIAARTNRPRPVQLAVNAVLGCAVAWFVLFHFLDSALSFTGWRASLYAASLALTLTLWGLAVVLPFIEQSARREPTGSHLLTWGVLLVSCALALAFPSFVQDNDWSGFLQSAVTLLLWVVVSVCIFRLRPRRAQYSLALLVGVIVGAGAVYKGLQATEIFWSRPLGSTDDEISLNLVAYAGEDNSFHLAHLILGNSRHEVCGDLCRILRENTNIRDMQAKTDIQLVYSLSPTKVERPNIFVFVIYSMRTDYL